MEVRCSHHRRCGQWRCCRCESGRSADAYLAVRSGPWVPDPCRGSCGTPCDLRPCERGLSVEFPLLTLIVFLPLAGAIVVALLGDRRAGAARWTAALVAAADLALVAVLVSGFDVALGMQFVEKHAWVPQVGITYHLSVDGMSLAMLALSSLLSLLAIVASWNTEKKPSLWFAMLLLLEVGMNGVFVAMDFVLFYVFWELVLVPMYFLIGTWGGPRREYAAIKFFLYTLFGSVFMLVGIIALYLQTG
ncbi:hypothetical protein EG835_06955, partial [bacterium]|nr:hypothetical protein [bacterium]